MSEMLSDVALLEIWVKAANEYRSSHPGSCDKQRYAACEDVRILIASHRALQAERDAIKDELATVLKERNDLQMRCDALQAELVAIENQQGLAEERRQFNRTIDALKAELAAAKAGKDGAYLERNKVVAALARLFPSGIAKTAIDGWSEDWHGCVYIDLPIGQVSWHYHDSHAYLFQDLPAYEKPWDGHTTEEKYHRLMNLAAQP